MLSPPALLRGFAVIGSADFGLELVVVFYLTITSRLMLVLVYSHVVMLFKPHCYLLVNLPSQLLIPP